MKKYLVLGMALLMVLSVMAGVAAVSDPQGDGVQRLRPKDIASPNGVKGEYIDLRSSLVPSFKTGSWTTFGWAASFGGFASSCSGLFDVIDFAFEIDDQPILDPMQYCQCTETGLYDQVVEWIFVHPPFSAGTHSWEWVLNYYYYGGPLDSRAGSFEMTPPGKDK